MKTDDDDLGIDLDAWQPPPPPPGIADAVVARMRDEVTAVTTQAVPAEDRDPRDHDRPRGRRVWYAGVAAIAAAGAVAGMVVFGTTRPPADTRGGLVADRPAHVAIGPTSADLDPGTAVRWQRTRYRVAAQQAGGGATWRVDDDDTLTIETAVGSIEATNASLRVEVQMLDEKQQIALSAVTAAAVALVTVVVYEGTVRVTREGAATEVAAGGTYRIAGQGEHVIEKEITVGAAVPDPDLAARVAALEAQLAQKQAELEAVLAERQVVETIPPVPAGDAGPRPPDQTATRASLQRDDVATVMRGLASRIRGCASGYDGRLQIRVRVAPDGTVSDVTATPPDAPPSACVVGLVRAARFARTQNGGSFSYPFVFTADATTCDSAALVEQGRQHLASGNAAAALDAFERADRCKPDASTRKLALLAACKGKNHAKAAALWRRMDQATRATMLSVCVTNGITQDVLEPAMGRLRIHNARPAKVLIDGVVVGVTPLDSQVVPGRHKVTLVIGDDKHTFSVVVNANETVVLRKTLP